MITALHSIISAAMLLTLSICAYEDIKSRHIANIPMITIAILTGAELTLTAVQADWTHLIGKVGAGTFMFIIYFVLLMINPNGIGGADVKVMCLVMCFFGGFTAVVFIIFQSLSVIVYWIWEKLKNKKNIKSVPLMVFIYIGFLITKYIFEVIL